MCFFLNEKVIEDTLALIGMRLQGWRESGHFHSAVLKNYSLKK